MDIRKNTKTKSLSKSCGFLTLLNGDLLFHGPASPSGPGPPHYQGFTITIRHNTIGRTPLDEWSTDKETST